MKIRKKYLNQQVFYGLMQSIDEKWYLWPGFSFWNVEKMREFKNKELNFEPVPGLDTGGNWNALFKRFTWPKYDFAFEEYIDLYDNIVAEIGHDFTKTVRNSQISDIDRSWIHFIYGSRKRYG